MTMPLDADVIDATPVRLGVVGGGQLGRMLAEAASPLGVEVIVLDPTPDCPAAAVARDQVVGDFDDADALRELVEEVDALTVEIELADPDLLTEAATTVPVHPAPSTVRMTRDKLAEKRALADADIPVPAFRAVDDADELGAAFSDLDRPLMLKARRGGYDGRGNAVVEDTEAAREYFGSLEGLIAERLVPFERELSAIGVRGADDIDAFPVVENLHREEILRATAAPARTSAGVRRRAKETVLEVLDVLEGRGVFGIELFETATGEILVNEIAPRPHNSGHYTIEGAHTSQFEQHVRAVLGSPLGDTGLRAPTAMANILGDVDEPTEVRLTGVQEVLAADRVGLHWYGKREARPLRKMGHLTAVAGPDEETDTVLDRVQRLREGLRFRA